MLSLARELGTPVALVSATTGEGLIAVQNFLASATRQPGASGTAGRRKHPRLSRVGRPRWAKRQLSASGDAGLDGASGLRSSCIVLWGPIIFGLVVIGVFQMIFAVGQPLSNLLQKLSGHHRCGRMWKSPACMACFSR